MEDKKKTDEKKSSILYNHAEITIEYHEPNPAKTPAEYRIVFFQVQPYSIAYTQAQIGGDGWKNACSKKQGDVIDLEDIPADKPLDLLWTYNVKFVRNEKTTWSQRWDRYIEMQSENQIHWFSIVNSFMIVLFLTGMVAMIMMRTLNADFRRINAQDPEEPDETGWKLVHGDVFRPPQRPMVFSVLIGSGVQILGMVIISLIFAVLGFLAPANRGLLLTAALVLYVWMGIFGGYASTRVYKMFKGQHWKKNTILTSISFPGVVFLIFFILNFFLWGQHSSGAVPFGTLVALVALWFGISVPLSFLGSYFAWKKPPPEQPVRTNQIPRGIPPQVWYMHPVFSVLLGGILPFGAVFIELFFILASIWLQDYYYHFSFLFIVFVILIVMCAEITIVMCYYQLSREVRRPCVPSYL
jgi:transmembrane 9 superfamily protein 2/4